jgi:hypothetical protein
MPGDFRCDLTNACAFYHYHCTRGYRAHRAPGIPCALVVQEGTTTAYLGRDQRREAAVAWLTGAKDFYFVAG